jgi:hypothetical protein
MPRRGSWVAWLLCGAVLLAVPGVLSAASPPPLINYQGVLRGPADEPLTGTYDMTFRFFDAETGGNELLIDSHLALGGQEVIVDGGLFSVALGSGTVTDGSGPGAYLSLNELFRDNTQVWLEVQIGAETLAPRTRVLASGYAINAATADSAATATSATTAASATDAANLGGQAPTYYLDTSATRQFKNGSVRFTSVDPNSYSVEAIADPGGFGALWAQGTNAVCLLGRPQSGIQCGGDTYGGYFYDANEASWAYAGYNIYGLYANGTGYGTYSSATNASGIGVFAGATGPSGIGLYASGVTGAHFIQSNNPGPYTKIAYSGYGVLSISQNGIHAVDYDDSSYSRIGAAPYKIVGNGSVSFVQNHPDDPDKVVVYHAPESAEVNVYTRGSARLDHGIARIALDPTFAWTANPDIGLTAHLTPRGEPVALAVTAVSTTELEVRGPAASNVAFDYWVTGLRIGFEEMPPVKHKEIDSAIPAKAAAKAIYEADPSLRAFNALERNKAMDRAIGRPVDPEMKAATALRDHIGVTRPMHPSGGPGQGAGSEPPVMLPEATPAQVLVPVGATVAADGGPAMAASGAAPPTAAAAHANPDRSAADPEPFPFRSSERFATSTPIEAGDVVVLDPATPGAVRRSDREADRTVVGIALAPAAGGFVDVAVGSIALVRVDAAYGAVRAGDLLVSSPAAGTAMGALAAEAGTILGKALEPLDSGLGAVRVLVMLR